MQRAATFLLIFLQIAGYHGFRRAGRRATTPRRFCAPNAEDPSVDLAAEFANLIQSGDAKISEGLRSVAGIPRSPSKDLEPREVVDVLMLALQHNDEPSTDSGFATCFAFADEMCRAAVAGSGGHATLEDFVHYAKNPTFLTMVNCVRYDFVGDCNVIPGSQTRGALATQMVEVETKDNRKRQFLWTLQQQRRPPYQGMYLVRECLAKDRAIYKTL